MSAPNVLWIVSDHQAFANRNVDPALFPLQVRLRALGTAFSRAYTVLPICTPARASMLTGLYPHSHGLTENDGRFGGRAELDHTDHLVNHDFRRAGYRCGWVGKWHLSQKQTAQDFGFEGFSLPGYGYPYGTEAYRAYLSGFHQGPLWAEVEVPGESRRKPGERIDMTAQDHWFDYEAGSATLHGPEEVHEAFFLADIATQWIESIAEETPFVLRLDAWGPHPPYTIPTGFSSPFEDDSVALSGNLNHDLASRPEHHQEYRDQWREDLPDTAFDWPRLTRRAIEHCILVERALVRVVEFLKETGRLENTIIVFCADHGDAVASNGGVMNKGSLMVEETMRIPLLFAGPGIAAGQQSDTLIGNIDLAPTVLDLCGLSGTAPMQGLSAAAHLSNPTTSGFRDHLMVQHYGLHVPILQRGLYLENWKYVIQPDGFEELYDLDNDPCETKNLADIGAFHAQVQQMRRLLRDELKQLGDVDPRLSRINEVLQQDGSAVR